MHNLAIDDIEEDQLLTPGEAGRLLDPPISGDGVKYLEARGQVRSKRTASGRRLYFKRDILRIVSERAAKKRAVA